MANPRRPVEPLLEMLIEGKVPKQIGAALGVTPEAIDRVLRRHVLETGCKTLIQAVAKYARRSSPDKPPEGVD